MVFLRLITAVVASCAALRPLQCPLHRQLFATYENLEDTLEHFLGFYGGFNHGRAKVVTEHLRLFQINSLAKDFLEILESFRLFACLILCPQACAEPDLETAFSTVRLVEKLNNLQLDLELLLDEASADFRLASQTYLREAKSFAANLLAEGPEVAPEGIDWDEAHATCVARVGSRILFPAMQVLSLQSKNNQSHIILSGVTTDSSNPAASSSSYISPLSSYGSKDMADIPGELSFDVLRSLATAGAAMRLYSGPGGKSSSTGHLCHGVSSPFLSQEGDVSTESGWPRRWRFSPYGERNPTPKVIQLLDEIEAIHMDLSHSFIALRPSGTGPGLRTSVVREEMCTMIQVYVLRSLALVVRSFL